MTDYESNVANVDSDNRVSVEARPGDDRKRFLGQYHMLGMSVYVEAWVDPSEMSRMYLPTADVFEMVAQHVVAKIQGKIRDEVG